MTDYRAGIVGTGGVAGLGTIGVHDPEADPPRASHAGGYEATDGVELVAAADVNEDALTAFSEAWGVEPAHRYGDIESMLAAEDLDVVSVCTPAVFHCDHVLRAAEAGVDVVLCEKPIASSLAEADEMIAACDETGTDLVVNYTLRFTEKFQRLRDHIEIGSTLGEVHSVAVQSRMELMRNASHVFDLLVFLFGRDVDTVWGHVTGENESVTELGGDAGVDDAAGRAMVSLGGTPATVDCTIPRAASSISYQFIGTEGKLAVDLDEGEWRYRRLEDGSHVPDEMAGIDGAWTWDEDYVEGFENAVVHVVDRLNGSEQTVSTGRDAVSSLETLVAVYVSQYTGSRVSLPLERPFRGVEIRSW